MDSFAQKSAPLVAGALSSRPMEHFLERSEKMVAVMGVALVEIHQTHRIKLNTALNGALEK